MIGTSLKSITILLNSWHSFFRISSKTTLKDKIYNPGSSNEQSPAEGMGAVNSFNPEEVEDMKGQEHAPIPKNFEREDRRTQSDDTKRTEE